MEDAAAPVRKLSMASAPAAETRSSSSPLPSQPPATSTLTENMPVDIRLKVFRLALREECGLALIRTIPRRIGGNLNPARINVALFTVNRQVSTEAQDAFFDVNTFTVRSVDKMTTTLAQLRHLQFAGKAALDICHRYLRPLDVVFRTASLLPQLRTITVPCDELAQDDQKTVRGVLCSQSQGNEFDLRCIDVGLFEVTPAVKVNCKIYFENIGLRRMLPQAKQYATEYQPGRLADLERAENSKPYAERLEKQERASIGCGIWFQYYELMRVKREGDAAAFTRWLAAPEQEGMRFYVQDWFADSESVPWISPLLPNGVKMLDLIVEGCTSRSPELLEWASEYMSLNVYTGADRMQD